MLKAGGSVMDFTAMNDKAVLGELGARIQRRRLAMNISQTELTRKAGVARKVIQNIESGQGAALKGFVRTLRALGLIAELELLLPEPGPSPLELARLKGRERLRASGLRAGRGATGGES
jgi:transcriptional regulator with XRE-family HTH domain